MTELPKNGWYVELPKNKDDINLDKLSKAFDNGWRFYREDGDKIYKYYYFNHNGVSSCTWNFEYVKNFKNVTHLFLRKPEQPAAESNRAEPELSESEIIEIDGRKFRLVPEQANFKNCDIVMKDGKEYEFIGYYEADVILRECVKGELSQHENVGLFKLEEIKTRTLHYAICKNGNDLRFSSFYDSKEELEDFCPNVLKYCTFEEQL